MQRATERAFGIFSAGKVERLVGTAIPEHHGPAAVLAARNDALEAVVLDRMILDFDGEPSRRWIEARSLRDGPALHDAAELEPEVVVEVTGGVLLDDERECAAKTGNDHAATRLRG